ncbi:MAG: type II toxin-antitoxin system PemK/MazF family toxin [Micrococcales bacterium]|nr:type II toxin-antitoxin system PemK/MazF family toxin [Micrococcales bacterium]
MRPIVLAALDKTRPVLVLTRDVAFGYLSKVTIAPITSTVRGLSTELPLGPANGLDHSCVASCDNVTTIAKDAIIKQVGYLHDSQEADLTRSLANAFDLQQATF